MCRGTFHSLCDCREGSHFRFADVNSGNKEGVNMIRHYDQSEKVDCPLIGFNAALEDDVSRPVR